MQHTVQAFPQTLLNKRKQFVFFSLYSRVKTSFHPHKWN